MSLSRFPKRFDGFYQSLAWRTVAAKARKRDGYMCQGSVCRGHGAPGRHVHHEIPRWKRPDLALVLENLVTLCELCHALEHPGNPSILFPERWRAWPPANDAQMELDLAPADASVDEAEESATERPH